MTVKPLSTYGIRKSIVSDKYTKDLHQVYESVFPELNINSGTIIRNYCIDSIIGVGGFGKVYKGENISIKQSVAIKLYLIKDKNALEAFKRGANFLAQLKHPNIITLYDFFIEGELAVMVMELIEPNITLRSYVGEFSYKNAHIDFVRNINSILEAMRYCHQKQYKDINGEDKIGVFHGDIKPDNIFILPSKKILMTDFMIPDLERFLYENTNCNEWVKDYLAGIHVFPMHMTEAYGTPMYMSPEQQQDGLVSEQTDIYNIGITMFELMTGFYPYEGTLDYLHNTYQLPEQYNPFCPSWLSEIIVNCIQNDPSQRYKHIAEIQRDIISFSNGEFADMNNQEPSNNETDSKIFELDIRKTETKSQLIYSIGGLFLGFCSIIGGVILFLNGVAGSTNWTVKFIGAESNITDASAGVVLFIVGLFIVYITRFVIKKQK